MTVPNDLAQDRRAAPTLAEAIIQNFYHWERRGRGWAVWNHGVTLEPPFVPFFHRAAIQSSPVDDGRRPGLFERIVERLGSRPNTMQTSLHEDSTLIDAFEEPSPTPDEAASEIVEFQIQLPSGFEVSRDLAEQVLLSLGGALGPVSFELVGLEGGMVVQFTVRREDASIVRQTVEAYLPEATVHEEQDCVSRAWTALEGLPVALADFGLFRECMLPIRTPRTFSVDPLIAFVGALDALREREFGIIQVMFERTAYPWTESIARAMTDGEGHAFFTDAPETLSLARQKVSRPLFASVVRVAARAATEGRAWQLARTLGNAFSQFTDPASNELVALSNDGYPELSHSNDVLSRRSHRSGMLLSVEELAGIVHLPSASVRAPSLRSPARKTKSPPSDGDRGDVTLGENVHRGMKTVVKIRSDLRLRHTYLIGATGTGKSTLLLSLIRQDIQAGRGVGLIDPHGDLVDEVLGCIPEERHRDVVLFDPSDEECPVGFNILRAHSERETELLASDLVAVFRRLSTSWGDQMTAILGNAVLAFLESDRGGTLIDLRRFLVDREFREEFLRSVRDPAVVSFWRREYPLISGRPQVPLLTRLDSFLRPRSIRRVVAQQEGRLDIGAIMDQGGIFLGKIAQGAIGEENAYLMGSLLVSKFHQLALARERQPAAARRDFLLYLDEFHHFVTPSLASILAGARKYHVGLVLAHQELRQLRDRELESAVLTNAATRMCFRLGDDDARKLAEGFSAFGAEDLQNLGIGEAICRLERADHDFNLRVLRPAPVESGIADVRRASIRDCSRSAYGTPKAKIEAILAEAYRESMPQGRNGPPPDAPVEESRPNRASRVEERQVLPTDQSRAPEPVVNPDTRPAAALVPLQTETESAGGRGGAQHKYLQSLIKHYAEERGFRATIEGPVSSGGRVDVLLERDGQSIACEISIGSSTAQEVGNVKKCLIHGCGRVAVVSPERKTLKRIAVLAEKELSKDQWIRLSFVTPEELLLLLDNTPSPQGERASAVLGYQVKTRVKPLSPNEQEERRATVIQTILRSLKRLKGKD